MRPNFDKALLISYWATRIFIGFKILLKGVVVSKKDLIPGPCSLQGSALPLG